jgi:hypothetical protein
VAILTLREAAQRLSMTPLQVVVHSALHGISCDTGMIDEDLLSALGYVDLIPDKPDGLIGSEDGGVTEEADQERRQRVVQRVLEKLSTAGKFWPARLEKRSAARGFSGSDVGLALRAVEALHDAGFLAEEVHGGHEPRVGLEGSRRSEIAEIVAGGRVQDDNLRAWINEG